MQNLKIRSARFGRTARTTSGTAAAAFPSVAELIAIFFFLFLTKFFLGRLAGHIRTLKPITAQDSTRPDPNPNIDRAT
jgi:hypothetical protein